MFQDFSQPMTVVAHYAASLDAGTISTFGLMDNQGSGVVVTRAARDEPRVLQALIYLVRNCLGIVDAIAVRLAWGRRRLPKYARASGSILVWWWPSSIVDCHCFQCPTTAVDVHAVLGEDWPRAHLLQVSVPAMRC